MELNKKIVGVMVTQSLPSELEELTRPIPLEQFDTYILIVNSIGENYETTIKNLRIVNTGKNLGGAGGFSLGIQLALQHSPDWIWTSDDDARPEDALVLSNLISCAETHDLNVCAPIIVEPDQNERLSFPFWIGRKRVWMRSKLDPFEILSGQAHLFNGTLFRASAINEVGIPLAELFIRGDEQEYLMRFRKFNKKVASCSRAAMIHPGAGEDLFPVFPGLLKVSLPRSEVKLWYQIRNRGFNVREYKRIDWLVIDFYRYSAYCLIQKKPKLKLLRTIFSLYLLGLRRNLGKMEESRVAINL